MIRSNPGCVGLRCFASLTSKAAAKILVISARTADCYWLYARAWSRREKEGTSQDEKMKKRLTPARTFRRIEEGS
jgi:hypothetical protein